VRKPPKNPLLLFMAATAMEAVVSLLLNRLSTHVPFGVALAMCAIPLILIAAALWRNERGYGHWIAKQFNAHRWPYVVMAVIFIPALVFSSRVTYLSFKSAWASTASPDLAQKVDPPATITPTPAAPQLQPQEQARAQTGPTPKPKHHKKPAAPEIAQSPPCTPENRMILKNVTSNSNLPPDSKAHMIGVYVKGNPCLSIDGVHNENMNEGVHFEPDSAKPQEKPEKEPHQ
jgi:hypothetical protein